MTGPFDRLGPAQDLIAYMISPEFQKRFSISVGLMPANFQAPVLESTNGAILLKTLQAEGLLGVNPDPRDEPQVKGLDSLLAAIRESPANWTSLVSRQK
jgi:hypothetical protein